MPDRFLQFVDIANPHQWLLASDNLHSQAIALSRKRGDSIITRIDRDGRVQHRQDATDKTIFLLSGFALENAIKAFLVYENPHWISNGKISTRLRSHSLSQLQRQSSSVPFKRRYLNVLTQFEEGLESWARYPCGISVDSSYEVNGVSLELWDGYLRLMEAYGRSLVRLLSSKLWSGPHGFVGRWTFSGSLPLSRNG